MPLPFTAIPWRGMKTHLMQWHRPLSIVTSLLADTLLINGLVLSSVFWPVCFQGRPREHKQSLLEAETVLPAQLL